MKTFRITFGTRDEAGDFAPYAGADEQIHEVEADSPRAAIDLVSDHRGHRTASSVDRMAGRQYEWQAMFDDPDDLALIVEFTP